ncbi:hypothetical protein M569_02522 [Genlisea aurea]|uniref:Pentacotripeptide-repeat region of PRORP domain-containing protein n=1 Tax=Genlisea aurea TaxID=192259 RepID=S8CZ06_9LAMI|nr:hypothetical protein M569_02522 [Genlisea aurea]
MASSTPPPHCALTTAKPYPGHHHFNHPQNHRRSTSNQQRQNWTPQKVSLNNPAASHASAGAVVDFPCLSVADFSSRRSTRFVSKMHFGRPRSGPSTRHSAAADEALSAIVSDVEGRGIETILRSFESKLSTTDDYTFLLRELGNRGDWMRAMQCFEFAIAREKRRNEMGKLGTSMISTLGRLGKVELAKKVFQTAVNEGYGNTVYAYSALISAYAKSGYCDEAIALFESMKALGMKPNLITYNALIDACGKGGADYKRAMDIFYDMVQNGVQPDRITYNSLLAVCSGAGLWETARSLFDEMVYRGVDQDIYTYNTLLDAACSGGHMDSAFEIMSEMPAKNVMPNEVTYSTMIRGCAKSGRLEKGLNLFAKMKIAGIKLDRVSYNTLVSIYANLGRFEEAFSVAEEMENFGIKKDVVTYNALLDGFGKQSMYDKVKALFVEMKRERLLPNLLTYSTLISVFLRGGLCEEAIDVYSEFKRRGLKADVVFYSKLIDALCKKGLVESSALLVDEMVKLGIRPNIVTYNSIINAFGQSEVADSVAMPLAVQRAHDKEGDRVIEVFKQLSLEKSGNGPRDGGKRDFRCVLAIFGKMHEMEIKPNVVTFSAILNACSRCNSFEDASLLLEELRLVDNHVYGVAHGLLTGYNDSTWSQATALFDDVKRMDSSTASAFYNALTDMLWHFGQVSFFIVFRMS